MARCHARIAAFIVVASLLSATQASAQAKVKIVGIGASSCNQFAREITSRPEVERDYFAWAQGFMSGIMSRAPGGMDEGIDLMPRSLPLLRQAEFLRVFCAGNPGADYSDAVLSLYRELRRLSTV